MDPIFITGTNKGLGHALAQHYLDAGHTVCGLSRQPAPCIQHANFHGIQADMDSLEADGAPLQRFLDHHGPFSLVLLNAGILGGIARMETRPIAEFQQVMNTNVWGNKVLLDMLMAAPRPPAQVIAISSGAAVNGSAGWGPYSISKAALNILLRVSAHENPDTHMCALAPGLVGTAMLDTILDAPPRPEYNADTRLREAREAGKIQPPEVAAKAIAAITEKLKTIDTGSFVDIRNLPF